MYFTIGGFTLDDTVLPDGSIQWSAPGGNVLYSAIGARIWTDQVGIISPIGKDYPQDHLNRLHAAGFNLEGVHRIDHPNFHVWVLHEGDGKRQIIYRLDSGKNEMLDPRPEDLPEHISRARGVHICPILGTSQARLLESLLDMGVPTTLDLIVVPDQIDVTRGHNRENWRSLRALLPSIEEVQALFGDRPLGDLIDHVAEVAPPVFAIKLGHWGCVVRNPADKEIYKVPAYSTTVVDTTGAGDAFCGGFLVGLQETGSPVEAALMGTVSASFVIEGYGALHALDVAKENARKRLSSLRPLVSHLRKSELSEGMLHSRRR